MTFAHPYLLLLLLLLPPLAWLKGKRGSPPAFLYSSIKLVEGLTSTYRSRAGVFLAALRWLTLALFIVALAQPRLTKNQTTVKESGVDIVVAFDLSGSMMSEDFVVGGKRVNRFNMARSILKSFIDKRPSDRLGLVVFATQAFIATPLTLDHDFLQENLDRLEIGSINPNATAIGDALATAVNQMRDLKAKSKTVILMTDGENNSGKIDPLTAAQAAHALGVKVYTIGVSKNGMAPMPVGKNPFTGETVYQDEPVDVDETTLQKIAQMTGGNYYRADDAEHFKQIYATIDKLEKTEAVVNKFTEYTELFPWFVSSGLALLLIEFLLTQTIFRKLP
ncbi:MAG TPA: VWA domain-containing protein [Verrucomicrobiae bacterium]|jgi:Ca-activated chloride channel family protein